MTTESLAQQHVRQLWNQLGGFAWRNNSGAFQDETGRVIRYGLANESKVVNEHIKSSDLIGPVPTLITADMIGRTVGVFAAVEMKKPGWSLTPSDKRAIAQQRFHELVRSAGGFAGFATCREDFLRIIGR